MRRVLAAGLALLALGTGSADAPLLRELVWTAPGADVNTAPRECLPANADASIETGRALFASPTMLGGPAARTGLSCESCHSNGRRNAHFFLSELTNVTGSVDVTSEWASRVRGDGVMNPRPIPDLAGAGSRTSFGRLHEPSLSAFVHSVIVEEFQGAEPPPRALASIVAYVSALEACAGEERVTLALRAEDVRRAARAASREGAAGESATALLVARAVQDRVGRIVERLPARSFARERRQLEQLAREWGGGVLSDAQALAWRARFDGLIVRLLRRERETYFNPARLARDLPRARAGAAPG